MPYGTIKVDNITFDNGGTDKLLTVSGLFFSTSGALTVTGTISGGNVTAPTATFTTLTGTTTAGTTATFTSGSFTSLTGVTTTVTSGVFGAGSVTAPSVAVGTGTTYSPGIYSPGADQLAISTNGVGRVLVSNTSTILPSGSLLVGQSTNPSAYTFIANTGSGSNNNAAQFTNNADAGLNIRLTSGVSLVDASTGILALGTSGTEKARLDSSGRLVVGTIASPAHQLQVSTDSAGKPSSALWTIVSDERIKEDIELANLDLCYEVIKAIPLKRYKWRDDIYTAEQVTDRRKLGWIAQDVEAIFPKAVGTHEFKYNQVFEETIIPAVEEELDADGNVITPAQPERIEQGDLISEDVIEDCRDLNSDQLYAAMYGAVQKLIAKVETLEASNTELLARLSALEAA